MAIDFSLSAEQRELQQSARQFARENFSTIRQTIRPLTTPQARFAATRPTYERTLQAGFLRRLVPAPFGGGGTGLLDMAIVAEEFYAVDVNVPLTLMANLLGLMPILIAGTDAQRKKYLAPFLRGDGAPLAALGNSEPGGSANFALEAPLGTRTTAHLEAGEWVIDGEKQWVSSATGWDGRGADVITVVCRTPAAEGQPAGLSIIVVPRGTPGLELETAFDTLGHRGHLTPRFSLRGVRVPRDHLVGPMGGAAEIVAASFTGTAAVVGAMSVGLMRHAFDVALRFCRSDARGGPHPIIAYPTVGYMLAYAKAAIEACRFLTWRASDAYDRQQAGALELALHAKVFCSETAVRVITDLMCVVGIDSYSHELPFGELLQDAMALPLFDGGNMGVRRRQLHQILQAADYDPLATMG